MKPFIFFAVMLFGAAGASGQELAGSGTGAAARTADAVDDGLAAARAQANVKEAFARQRAAGLPAKADGAAIEAALRLEMRSKTASLRFGSRWRPYPDDTAFRNRAYLTGQELEKLAAGLGPVRTWTCSYDKKAAQLMNGAVGALIVSANARLYVQPPVPAYTGAERGYRFGPTPPVIEAEPARDEGSAGWLDWAAARAVQGAAARLRSDRAAAELEQSTGTALGPDQAQLREAVRLWRLAAALQNGGTAPKKISAAKLDAAAAGVADAVAKKYGAASSEELAGCGLEDYVSAQAGRAAKRLLARPKAGARKGQGIRPV